VDDLGAGLALCLGLLGHGAEHGLGHVDLFDLDGDDFYAEGGGVAVDDGLNALVEGLAVGEELVEIDLAEDGAEGGLGELGGLVDVVCDLDDRFDGVDDAEGDDGVDLEGDVVAGDDVLRGDLHRFLTERDADDTVDGAEDEDNARACGVVTDASEPEDDGTLVFAEDLDAVEEVKNDDGDGDERWERHGLDILDRAIVTECWGEDGFRWIGVGSAVAWRVGRIWAGFCGGWRELFGSGDVVGLVWVMGIMGLTRVGGDSLSCPLAVAALREKCGGSSPSASLRVRMTSKKDNGKCKSRSPAGMTSKATAKARPSLRAVRRARVGAPAIDALVAEVEAGAGLEGPAALTGVEVVLVEVGGEEEGLADLYAQAEVGGDYGTFYA
jgi:hypothetical protein